MAEFHRVPRERDPISFFRDQLPIPKVEEKEGKTP
jgi:hypothetical protein